MKLFFIIFTESTSKTKKNIKVNDKKKFYLLSKFYEACYDGKLLISFKETLLKISLNKLKKQKKKKGKTFF